VINTKQEPIIAEPLDPVELPKLPTPSAIVATLPRREKENDLKPPRPEVDVNSGDDEQEAEALAFNVPVPEKKPTPVINPVQFVQAVEGQDEIAAAVTAINSKTPLDAPTQPSSELRPAVAADAESPAQATEQPFLAGTIPVPNKKPKAPTQEVEVAVLPTAKPTQTLELEPEVVPNTPPIKVTTNNDTIKTAPIKVDIPESNSVASEKTSKPKPTESQPAIKTIIKTPPQEVQYFALSTVPVKIVNQPVAPEYAQAVIRAAPSEVLVSGFSDEGPQNSDQFSGKAVNFLRVARFETKKE
jgi:hypothetical protein